MKQVHSTEFAAPPAAVFHWLDDPQRVMQWIEGVVENENIDETEEKVGTTFRQVFEENGKRMNFSGVVTAWEQDRRMAIAMEGDFFDMQVDYELEPTQSGTRMTQTTTFQFKGLWKVLGLLMLPLMKKSGTKKLLADWERLRVLCEAS